ncbi:hypothetical protein DPEC_G00100590 [Dallia pectoralis]|uniref:Uncharacterized protein n=1 Tax=Dallia pectoralis TaxID=75939 RepID=A0ACC2GW75_DALPE|nr:hypothetical protein DPEC_G00100590 [Dallia pectoralis]
MVSWVPGQLSVQEYMNLDVNNLTHRSLAWDTSPAVIGFARLLRTAPLTCRRDNPDAALSSSPLVISDSDCHPSRLRLRDGPFNSAQRPDDVDAVRQLRWQGCVSAREVGGVGGGGCGDLTLPAPCPVLSTVPLCYSFTML